MDLINGSDSELHVSGLSSDDEHDENYQCLQAVGESDLSGSEDSSNEEAIVYNLNMEW